MNPVGTKNVGTIHIAETTSRMKSQINCQQENAAAGTTTEDGRLILRLILAPNAKPRKKQGEESVQARSRRARLPTEEISTRQLGIGNRNSHPQHRRHQ